MSNQKGGVNTNIADLERKIGNFLDLKTLQSMKNVNKFQRKIQNPQLKKRRL